MEMMMEVLQPQHPNVIDRDDDLTVACPFKHLPEGNGEKALADSKVRKRISAFQGEKAVAGFQDSRVRTSLAEDPLENRGLTSSEIDLELYGSAVLSLRPLHRTTHIQSGEPFGNVSSDIFSLQKCFWTVAKLTASWDAKEQIGSLKGWGTDQHGIYVSVVYGG
ncbi:hypothetical protein SUGI_0852950 [Cryptomeria japonica]|nr:hypothetical protein SUGI_0852950 [Cryptomeria japonica]